MKSIIAKIADGYGLNSLHKEYSKRDQFYIEEEEVSKFNSNHDEFYKKPMLPEINYEDGRLKFLSQIDNGESNRNAVFYYNEFNKEGKNVSVIFIHGWRSSQLNRLENVFLDSFIEKEYNTYSYILPFHMERGSDEELYSGENFYSANINRTLKSVQQSISDLRAMIRYLKEKRNSKIIVIGLSLGGLISNLLCEVEKEIDVLVSLFYANDLVFTAFDSIAGKFIKRDFISNGIDKDILRKSWAVINPCLKKPLIENRNILLVSGKYDKYVLGEDTDKLWSSWNKPKRIIYDCGHSGIVLMKNTIKNDVLKFIKEREL